MAECGEQETGSHRSGRSSRRGYGKRNCPGARRGRYRTANSAWIVAYECRTSRRSSGRFVPGNDVSECGERTRAFDTEHARAERSRTGPRRFQPSDWSNSFSGEPSASCREARYGSGAE